MNRSRVLVTGASGFLGSHICDVLHEAGYDVHALVRPTSSLQWLQHDWLCIHKVDYNDIQLISHILSKVDYVVHCAGVMATTSRNGRHSRQTNLDITRMLAEESAKAGIKRFIFTSSLAAGGPGQSSEARTEDNSDNPISNYGRSKKAAECMLASMSDNLFSVILRFSMIYGPRDSNILNFFKRATTRVVPLIGRNPIYTSMVHVKDAARAVVASLKADIESGSLYQITDGVRYTIDSIYGHIEEALEKDKEARRIKFPMWLVMLKAWWNHDVLNKRGISPDQVRQFKGRYWVASPEKARKDLDWRPEIDIKKGLADTVKWYLTQGWLPNTPP